MKKRFNLYYLFSEDQRNHPMRKEARERIQKILNHFFTKKLLKSTLPASTEEQK